MDDEPREIFFLNVNIEREKRQGTNWCWER